MIGDGDAGRLLRLPAVRDEVGLSTSSIYRLMGAREFPQSCRIGRRAVAWREEDVAAWKRTRPVAIQPGAGTNE